MPSNSGLTVSVIIPVYNGGANFRRCLLSLAKLAPPPAEIIVVANGDTDGSWQLAEEFGVKVIRLPSPVGPGRARNVGGSMAQGDVLFFVDADVAVLPDAIGRVAEPFHHNPDVAAVLGSYDDQPGASNFLSQYKNLFHHYITYTRRHVRKPPRSGVLVGPFAVRYFWRSAASTNSMGGPPSRTSN